MVRSHSNNVNDSVEPPCSVFGQCGGCAYQDIPYAEELVIKESQLKALIRENVDVDDQIFDKIVPSPQEYHYRQRLDLKIQRTKEKGVFMGFSPKGGYPYGIVPVEDCAIALPQISRYLKTLKEEAGRRLSGKYRRANLVIRSGDGGQVRWGGIGRRSLSLDASEYFWTEIEDKKIYYSLDTFFQANLSILPKVIMCLRKLSFINRKAVLLDLYGGVGLFSIGLAGAVKRVCLVEENRSSVKLARYNVAQNNLENIAIFEGRVEDRLADVLEKEGGRPLVAIIDPPRAGLSKESCVFLSESNRIGHLLYLSCNPEALARDLKMFLQRNWELERIIPFDFFPKTKHLEALVVLHRESG